MRKAKTWFIISISLMLVSAVAGTGEARSYYTWCKSFSTGENLACSTHTDYGGTHSYTPGKAPTIYNVPDNTLFNVQYEAADHEKALFSMFVDSNTSSCAKGANCNFSNDKWKTRCVWNGKDAWVCTIYYQEAQINQYYLLTDYSVRNYRYLALSGNSNSPPIITAVPAMSYPENTGSLSNIVDLWFYTGDDRTPKQDLIYAIVSQTNPGVVSCSISSNRYINCSGAAFCQWSQRHHLQRQRRKRCDDFQHVQHHHHPREARRLRRPRLDAKFILPSTPAEDTTPPAASSETPVP